MTDTVTTLIKAIEKALEDSSIYSISLKDKVLKRCLKFFGRLKE